MASITTLVPTSIALSSDAAIEAILSDIPLFCEGIMGIGVFTFLFLTKQVNILAIFLYGSTFLAFAAATLDLGQVLARGPQDTAKGIGLDAVAGFIYAREVFLSLALGSLDLFFWRLVACCPRDELPTDPSLSTGNTKKSPKTMHSASWDQWGLVGVCLKWGSLVAVLAVPLLQIIWRTMPGQRKEGSVYVAETILQISTAFTFILKLLLNVYISPRAWDHALKLYFIPIGALLIGGGLGIGNIAVFAFTESSLGRFLRAVEVYILIVHSLYTTFHWQLVASNGSSPETMPPVNRGKEKFQGELPFAYTGSGVNTKYNASSQLQVTRRTDNGSRTSSILPRRTSSVPVIASRNERLSATPSINVVGVSPLQQEGHTPSRPEMRSDIPQSPSSYVNKVDSPKVDRPFTSMSLSYYTIEDMTKTRPEAIPSPRSRQSALLMPGRRSRDDVGTSNISSQQGSITSLDEIFRQQNELDKSIAALRLMSESTQDLGPNSSKQSLAEPTSTTKLPDQSEGTVNSSKTESLSNRSDFSLSIFPAPPFIEAAEVATKYPTNGPADNADTLPDTALVQSSGPTKRKDIPPITVPPYQNTSKVELSSDSAAPFIDPKSTDSQKDSTPPNRDPVAASSEEANSNADEVSDIGNATIGSAVVLRPMILASLIMNSPLEGRLSGNDSTNQSDGEERTTGSVLELSNTPNLRPLYLGKAPISSIPMMSRPTIVSLAQRRRPRGRTITSTQRPVIGLPRLNSVTEVAPGAFERPRTPPQRR